MLTFHIVGNYGRITGDAASVCFLTRDVSYFGGSRVETIQGRNLETPADRESGKGYIPEITLFTY